MKQLIIALSILFFFSGVSLHAKEISSMKDLKPGDSLNLRIGIPLESSENSFPWTFEHNQKIDLDLKVLSVNNDSVRFSVKPTHWLFCYRNNEKQRFIKETAPNVYYYFNSDLTLFYDEKPLFYLFDGDAVTVSVNKNNGNATTTFPNSVDENNPHRSAKEWYIQLTDIPKGLKVPPFDNVIPDYSLDFEKIANFTINAFFQKWNENTKSGQGIPQMIDVSSTPEKFKDKPAFLQLISASFDIQPNTHISFAPSPSMPDDRVFIEMDGKRIKPSKNAGNVYEFNLLLSSSKRAKVGNVILDLTPQDSLQVAFNASESKYQFKGKGSANSAYSNAIVKFYSGNTTDLMDEKALGAFIAEKETAYQSLLAEYKDDMNEYWIKSATLAFDYWCASQYFKLYNKLFEKNWRGAKEAMKYQIPWYDERILNLAPYSDYLYQPYSYDWFLDEYYTYTAWNANSTILTGFKYLQFGVSQYYFADAIFWGYPRFYLTSNTLKELMRRFKLGEYDREYHDFLSKCRMSELRQPIIDLHDQLLKIEPGANIKNANLNIIGNVPLTKKSDRYIALLVSDSLSYNPQDPFFEKRLENFHESMKKAELSEKVRICIIIPESQKTYFASKPEIMKQLIFVPDKDIRDYKDKVLTEDDCYILMRDDGTIIDRQQNGKYLDSPVFFPLMIKGDLQKQKNKDSALSRVLPVITIVLFTSILTFLLARYAIKRREKTRRKLLELELKAIRAQMNPHFTFNALGSIQNLISQKKDKEANEYLVNFAKLLRMILNTSDKMLVPLSEEITSLELYLHLEQLRVPFQYEINVSENIDLENEEIPSMLIQPIVENAVKHGITPKGGGFINLNFDIRQQILYVTVTDSGAGFSEEENEPGKGFGLQSVRERLKLLNKEYGLNIGLNIENMLQGQTIKGCKATISVPV